MRAGGFITYDLLRTGSRDVRRATRDNARAGYNLAQSISHKGYGVYIQTVVISHKCRTRIQTAA